MPNGTDPGQEPESRWPIVIAAVVGGAVGGAVGGYVGAAAAGGNGGEPAGTSQQMEQVQPQAPHA